jgi:hypothetical protein
VNPSEDPVRQAEFNEGNVARVRAGVETTLRRAGAILPDYIVDALVEHTLDETLAARRRIAYMVHMFNGAFGAECTPERLERLEICVLLHERDANNGVTMPIEVADDEA